MNIVFFCLPPDHFMFELRSCVAKCNLLHFGRPILLGHICMFTQAVHREVPKDWLKRYSEKFICYAWTVQKKTQACLHLSSLNMGKILHIRVSLPAQNIMGNLCVELLCRGCVPFFLLFYFFLTLLTAKPRRVLPLRDNFFAYSLGFFYLFF